LTNNKTHRKNINGGLTESQSHQSRPPIVSIVSTQKIVTAVVSDKITQTQTHRQTKYWRKVNICPVQNNSRKS